MFFWKKINEQCIEESCNEYDINNSKVGASLASEGGGKPPNIREIGRASWLYLHSMANKYPESPDETIKKRYNDWIRNFSDVYPCKTCRNGMKKLIHEFPPRLDSRKDFVLWMCDFHNKINKDLGIGEFRCDYNDLINRFTN